jgi:hypothetical protein
VVTAEQIIRMREDVACWHSRSLDLVKWMSTEGMSCVTPLTIIQWRDPPNWILEVRQSLCDFSAQLKDACTDVCATH